MCSIHFCLFLCLPIVYLFFSHSSTSPLAFFCCCCCWSLRLSLSHTLSPTIIIFSFFLIIYSRSFVLFSVFRFFCFALFNSLFFIFDFLQRFFAPKPSKILICLTGLLSACAVLQVYWTPVLSYRFTERMATFHPHPHPLPDSPRPLQPTTSTNLLTERKPEFPSQCKTGFRFQREDVFHGSKNIVWVIRSFLLERLDRRRQYKWSRICLRWCSTNKIPLPLTG